MKSRYLGIIFIAAVIVPSILLAVLSVRAAGREEAYIERQLATTLDAEVTHTVSLANAEVSKVIDELRAGIDVPATGEYAPILTQWQKSSALVSVPFLLSPRYGILWPRSGATLGEAEKRFLQENGDFLSDKTATTVLQNIAVRYEEEILAETRKAEAATDASTSAGAPASSAAEPVAVGEAAVAEPAAKEAPADAAPASEEAPAEPAAAQLKDAAVSSQMAIDAFAQSPAIQSKVYEQAREKGDQMSQRVVQPAASMLQNATVRAAAPTAAPATAATPPAATERAGSSDLTAATTDTSTAGALGAAGAAPGSAAGGAGAAAGVPAGDTKKQASAPPAVEQPSQFVLTSQLLSQIASKGDYGLIPRFIGEKLVFLFWERQKDGRIAGCEIAGSVFRPRIAGVLPGTYTPVRILTLLDENGAPLVTPPDTAGRNWRQPFVSREIGESLPRWEAAAYLTNPDSIITQARSSSLVIWILVLILFVSVAGGGTMVLTSVYGEIRMAQKKATFVANVSHELKTPLTSISLFVELLRQKRRPPAAKRERYLSLMAAETERLTRLINNVLDFSGNSARKGRERGGKRPAMGIVDAARVVEDIVESQRVRLESIGFTLALTRAGRDAPVRGDSEALKQVLLNLLTNAEKYSPDRKEIEVAMASAPDAVLINVRDRGIGVPEKERERIFREFYRVDDSLSSRVRGTGLGLTIARRIVRDHGGDITCGPREGGGSDFTVRLPAARRGNGGKRS